MFRRPSIGSLSLLALAVLFAGAGYSKQESQSPSAQTEEKAAAAMTAASANRLPRSRLPGRAGAGSLFRRIFARGVWIMAPAPACPLPYPSRPPVP